MLIFLDMVGRFFYFRHPNAGQAFGGKPPAKIFPAGAGRRRANQGRLDFHVEIFQELG
jgi:hypothetical protein